MTDLSFTDSKSALQAAAVARAGCSDFGDPDYEEGLEVVLDAYDHEARFSEAGRKIAYYGIVDILTKRLRSEQLLKQNPAVRDIEIRRPIIITGLVRTGSTALHHLIGQDPSIQVIEYWLANFPQPRPPRAEWETHPDYQTCAKELELMYAADPELRKIHWMMPDGAEECRHFLAQSFTDDFFEVNATVPSYTRWYEGKHMTEAYQRHRSLLQLVGSTSPERPWVLKYPVHMKHLAALLEVYPDACIVQTHRDPSQVMSSYISLVAGFRGLYEQDINREAIARDQLAVWADGIERGLAVRKRHDPGQFYDLHFRDFRADPVGSVRGIYEYFGRPFSEESERCLTAWGQQNPEGSKGTHEHSMSGVALSRDAILDRFKLYMDYFDISPE
jgi:hypothetical protein